MKKITILALIGLMLCSLFLFSSCGNGISAPTDLNIDVDYKLTWSAVAGARSYAIKIKSVATGKENEYTARKTSHLVSDLEEGDYEIKVKAIAGARDVEDSEWSETLFFHKNYETGCVYELVNNASYTIKSGGLAKGNVIIEDVYRGKPVTAIKENAFKNNLKIENVIIGKNVTTIGDYAFYNCYNLVSVTMPDSVVSMGTAVFQLCEGLTSVRFSAGMKYVVDHTFAYCKAMTSFEIPEGVQYIDVSAFSHCNSLESITFPDSLVYVGETAFTSCPKLTEVTFGDGLVEIGPEAFSLCDTLATVNFATHEDEETGNPVTNLKVIGTNAFYKCPALTKIEFPEGVTQLLDGAFNSCTALETVKIPSTVTSLAAGVFRGTKIYEDQLAAVAEGGDPFIYVDKWLVAVEAEHLLTLTDITRASFREGTVGIAANTFAGAPELSSISIPSSIKYVGASSFRECPKLYKAIFADGGVELIDKSAFMSCEQLANIQLGDSLKVIEQWAFYGCTMLQNNFLGISIIPDSVERIGQLAFYLSGIWNEEVRACEEGTTVNGGIVYAGNWAVGYIYFNQKEYIYDENLGTWLHNPDIQGSASLTLKEGTKGIADSTFMFSLPLKTVEGLHEVSIIGEMAFVGCKNLTTITLNRNLKEIKESTFNGCEKLADVEMPRNLQKIGRSAFYGCMSFTQIDLSSTNVTEIGRYAFYGCAGAAVIYLNEKVTTIEPYAFYGCTAVQSVTVPDSVTSLGSHAFTMCTSLEEVTLGNGLTELQEHTFRGAVALKSVTLGENLSTIGDFVFYQTVRLNSINLENVTEIGKYAFAYTGLDNFVLSENLTTIKDFAFKGAEIRSIYISKNVENLGKHIFYKCNSLVIYTDASGEAELDYNARWNSSYFPVVYGATYAVEEDSANHGYVKSIAITAEAFKNVRKNAFDQFNLHNPTREGYKLTGWATEEGGEAVYTFEQLLELPVGTTVYSVWEVYVPEVEDGENEPGEPEVQTAD